jgi:accessory gene regulator B
VIKGVLNVISRLAQTFAIYFSSKNAYGLEKIRIYKYGFELLISTVINLLGILFISVLMDAFLGAVFFCAAFVPLRLSAGGYHAKRHWTCISGFMAVFLVFAAFSTYTSTGKTLIYQLTAITTSLILVLLLSPVQAVNKPLKDEQRKRQRKRSIIIACVNLAIVVLIFIFDAVGKSLSLLSFYCSGAFAASLSLLVAALVYKNDLKRNTHEINQSKPQY